jgi:hypothetical protein
MDELLVRFKLSLLVALERSKRLGCKGGLFLDLDASFGHGLVTHDNKLSPEKVVFASRNKPLLLELGAQIKQRPSFCAWTSVFLKSDACLKLPCGDGKKQKKAVFCCFTALEGKKDEHLDRSLQESYNALENNNGVLMITTFSNNIRDVRELAQHHGFVSAAGNTEDEDLTSCFFEFEATLKAWTQAPKKELLVFKVEEQDALLAKARAFLASSLSADQKPTACCLFKKVYYSAVPAGPPKPS